MPTVQEMAAHLTLEAGAALGRTLHATPEDKAAWAPLGAGRPALSQIVECGGSCRLVAAMLRNRSMPPFDRSEVEKARQEYDTAEKALALLSQGVDEVVAAIRDFPDGCLGEKLDLPFRAGLTRSFAEIMFMPYWNMTYHLGQVNYIQTLYGDQEMH